MVDKVTVGLTEDQYVTIPTGQYQRLNVSTKIPAYLSAPIKKGDKVGDLVVQFDNKIITTKPLFALQDVEAGGFYTRTKDAMRLTYRRWFG